MSESHQSLYQKYRPRIFDDVVGQDFVKKVLMNSCRNNKIHHGYIFFGFHGTGKTTLARIFAQTVNCTNILADGNPCGHCANCQAFTEKKMIDVIEIDAASYTGVDNIRDIIEHAKFTPTQGKYKIYIIDEVHMLSKGAFNALLKTLEEPPKHVIFLLATTEINKVPDTVLSRVIRFDLERISTTGIKGLLEKICEKEGIKAENAALDLIVHRSRGSMRDSLTILEKCILDNTLSLTYVEGALHLVNQDFLKKTLQACISGDGKDIQDILETVQKIGINVRTFASQMTEHVVEHIEEALKTKQFPAYKNVFDRFTRIYIESQKVAVPMDILLMSLCECVTKNEDAIHFNNNIPLNPPLTDPVQIVEHTETTPIEETLSVPETETSVTSEDKIAPEYVSTQETTPPNNEPMTGVFKDDFIHQLGLGGIKPTLIPLLKTADITQDDTIITIQTTLFASKKCQESDTALILDHTAKSFGATEVRILLRHDEETPPPEPSTIDIAKEIFT